MASHRGVHQKMMNSRFVFWRSEFAEIFRDRIVDVELALLLQLQDRRGGECFGEAILFEARAARVFDALFFVGVAVTHVQDHDAALLHDHGTGEPLRFKAVEQGIELLRRCAAREE